MAKPAITEADRRAEQKARRDMAVEMAKLRHEFELDDQAGKEERFQAWLRNRGL